MFLFLGRGGEERVLHLKYFWSIKKKKKLKHQMAVNKHVCVSKDLFPKLKLCLGPQGDGCAP